MRKPDLFIIKLITIDTLTSSSVLLCDITTLHHEIWNNSMENVALIRQTLITSANASEIFSSLRDLLIEKFKDYSARLIAFFSFFSNSQIKESLRIFNGKIW